MGVDSGVDVGVGNGVYVGCGVLVGCASIAASRLGVGIGAAMAHATVVSTTITKNAIVFLKGVSIVD